MSEFWQWFFAIIGLVAFIMAAPYCLQLFFGQPKIGLVFAHDDTEREGRLIKVHLMNPPINSWLLQAFKVTRLPAQDVYLVVRVHNASTGEVVADSFMPEITLSSSTKSGRVSLPPSILMTNVTLAKWQRSSNSAVLLYGTRPISLQEGTYMVNILIGLDGKTRMYNKPCLLHIGKTETEMMWDKSIQDKFFV